MTKKYPKYMVRPDDYEIFSLNKEDNTYSSLYMKENFPNHLYSRYNYNLLKIIGFGELSKIDIVKYKNLQKRCKRDAFKYDREENYNEMKQLVERKAEVVKFLFKDKENDKYVVTDIYEIMNIGIPISQGNGDDLEFLGQIENTIECGTYELDEIEIIE